VVAKFTLSVAGKVMEIHGVSAVTDENFFEILTEIVHEEISQLFHALHGSVTEIDIELETDGGTTHSRAVFVDDGGFIITQH
jgi:hypothetical protein